VISIFDFWRVGGLRRRVVAIAILLVAGSEIADAGDCLVRGPIVTVTAVIDGDTVATGDGTEIRLVGIQAPRLPPDRSDTKPWPLGEEARAALETLVLGKPVTLSYGGARLDRHGRALAQLHTADGAWVQGEMVARGLARVYSFADNRALIADLLARERAARAERRGIWTREFYRVRDAAGAVGPNDSFQIVEGTVIKAAETRDRIFLNFGADWRTDFTATLASKDRRTFLAAGIDPMTLDGRRVRVRGWLYDRNGPAIDLTHPEQLEILDLPRETTQDPS
jgi:micrococcal nuclease